ncbi:MAG: hypothetical protein ACK44D_05490, partial [Bacteroidia bacterium]
TPKEKTNPPVFAAITPIVDLGQVNINSIHKVTFTVTNKGKVHFTSEKYLAAVVVPPLTLITASPLKKEKRQP